MNRLIALLIGFSLVVHAYTYNYELLQIYAKIAPRMMLLVGAPAKQAESRYLLYILYEPGDEDDAKRLQSMMEETYPDGFRGKEFQIRAATFDRCHTCADANLVMMLDARPETIRSVVKKANANGTVTMSYSSRFLEEGVMLSLDLGASVRPYINLMATKKGSVTVDDILLRISKVYQEGDGE